MADGVLDHVRGGLWGVAYGDAMGMPGELWPRAKVIEHFGWIDRFLPGPDGHFIVDGFVAGQTTDDTQQTLVLAQALVEGGGSIEPRAFGESLARWAEDVGASEGNFLGPTSARALKMIREGAPLEETGATGDTNGAAMRIVPVGLAYPTADLDALVDAVAASCRATHYTDAAIAGAALIAAAASAACERDSFDDVVEVAYEAADRGSRVGNATYNPSIRRRAELAVALVRDHAGDDRATLDALYDVVGAGVLMSEAAPTALAIAVAAGGDPARACRLAANLGGDTDTIGAMATGICGAFVGLEAFPAADVEVLRQANPQLDIDGPAAGLAEIRTGLLARRS